MSIKQEELFQGLPFEYAPDIGWEGSYKGLDGCYYHVDHFEGAYVIEVADDETSAFEDAYTFPDDWDESKIIAEVRDTLVKMCNGEM